jgi:hypothetical protein
MMVSVGTGSSTIVISGTGRPTTVTESSTTLYKEQPGTVRTILIALAIALVISTASVVWRVVRRSERLGVTGLIVAGLVGAVAPLAAFLVLLALPIAPARKPTPAPVSASPPGWYGDPSGSALLRYWDGQTWTVHSAPMRLPG